MQAFSKILLLAALIAALGSVAYAARGTEESDAVPGVAAPVLLAEAATTAEQYVRGKAVRAVCLSSTQDGYYDMEVVHGNQVFDVNLDAAKGNVLPSVEDKHDTGDEEDDDEGADAQPGHANAKGAQ